MGKKNTSGSIRSSLHAALTAAAPDGGSWLQGRKAFWAARKGRSTIANAGKTAGERTRRAFQAAGRELVGKPTS